MYKINLSVERYASLNGPEKIEALAGSIINYLMTEEKEDFKGEVIIELNAESCEDKKITSEGLLAILKNKVLAFTNPKTQEVIVTPLFLSPLDFTFYRALTIKYKNSNTKYLVEATPDSYQFTMSSSITIKEEPLTDKNIEKLSTSIVQNYLNSLAANSNLKLNLNNVTDLEKKLNKAVRDKFQNMLFETHEITDYNCDLKLIQLIFSCKLVKP